VTTMRIDVDRAVQAVRVAFEFDWTWTADDLPGFSDRAGWHLTQPQSQRQTPELTTNLDVDRPDAMVFLDDPEEPGAPLPLKRIWFCATDIVDDESGARQVLEEVAESVALRVSEVVGRQPTRRSIDPTLSMRWDIPKVFVKVMVGGGSVYISLISPEWQLWQDEIEKPD
jgi:hypothetical protein